MSNLTLNQSNSAIHKKKTRLFDTDVLLMCFMSENVSPLLLFLGLPAAGIQSVALLPPSVFILPNFPFVSEGLY